MDGFGNQLKQLRHEKGITQEELAGRLGISRQAVSKWESNVTQPDLDNLVKLSDILNVSLDTLMGHETAGVPTNHSEIISSDSGRYPKRVMGCLLSAAFALLLAYVLTLLKPELRVAEDFTIMYMWELQFWIQSRLFPLLMIAIASTAYAVWEYVTHS